MDDFAQTREADDLFDSEISTPPPPPPSAPTEPRAFTRGRPHSRRGSRGDFSRNTEKPAPKDSPVVEGAPEGPAADSEDAMKQVSDIWWEYIQHTTKQMQQDRTLSGGLKKPKLTEEELAARLERAKLNNERLIERRRKALEDESSFQAQEAARKQADATKRIVERKKKVEHEKNRKELDDEREKNRQRKLSAVNTREWDSTKTEEDYNPRKQSSQLRRGAHGGVISGPHSGSHDAPHDSPHDAPRDSPQYREGHRGGRRGRYRGAPRGAPTAPRGAYAEPHANATVSRGSPSKDPVTTQEWPDLPSVAKDTTSTKDETPATNNQPTTTAWLPTNDQPTGTEDQPSTKEEVPTVDKTLAENKAAVGDKAPEKAKLQAGDHTGDTLSPLSPAIGGGSWAEQVESAS